MILDTVTLMIADHIFTPDGFVAGEAVVFDRTIRAVGAPDLLAERFPDARIVRMPPHTVVLPGLINPHVHLEFSANRSDLNYGDFMEWLHSVIAHRDTLINRCDDATMEAALHEMLLCGITTVGAVSSYGSDLEVCKRAPQRVVFFCELIGSSAQMADALYGDFRERLSHAQAARPEERITPAVAIHAPYSVHPILLRKAVALAREQRLPLSTHFLESPAERKWLEEHTGGFLRFFQHHFGSNRAVTSIEEFIEAFDGYPSLFVHAVHTTAEERSRLNAHGHTVVHCPRSNRLLGCGRLPIEEVERLAVATDGLSSNWSLSIWDELRAALMMHFGEPLEAMSERLLRSVTIDAARALGSPAGRIEADAPADLIAVVLPDAVQDPNQLALQTILHAQKAHAVYIDGEEKIGSRS
jgi:cytosine/adenosine deaminase-related metal-dependent hydrolase